MKPINAEIIWDWSNGDGDMFEDARECVKHGCNNARKNLRCVPSIPCIVNQETGVFVTMMDILEEEDNKVIGCRSGTTSCVVKVVKDFDKFEKLINLLGDVNEAT